VHVDPHTYVYLSIRLNNKLTRITSSVMQNRNLQNMIRELEFRPESNPGFSRIEQAKIDGQAEDM